jgi:hypothetical protein
VVQVLVGEPHLSLDRPSGKGNGGQQTTARCLADPGGEDAPWGDEEAGLLVELADGTLLEVLALLKTSRRRLPGTGRALEH